MFLKGLISKIPFQPNLFSYKDVVENCGIQFESHVVSMLFITIFICISISIMTKIGTHYIGTL